MEENVLGLGIFVLVALLGWLFIGQFIDSFINNIIRVSKNYEDDFMTVKIVVSRIENIVLDGETITYIRDTNKRLFEIYEFDPNVLLCDPGTTIEVIFSKEYKDMDIIPVESVNFHNAAPI